LDKDRPVRIASYNVENLFRRPAAFMDAEGDANEDVIAAYTRLTELLAQESYAGDEDEIVERLEVLGLKWVDENNTAVIRETRGQLLKRTRDPKAAHVDPDGRADWIGWVELKRRELRSRATENTAAIIGEVNPDVLAVVEAEDRLALDRFNEYVLQKANGWTFRHTMLVDGNDERGIDVGAMAKETFRIGRLRSHIDDLKKGEEKKDKPGRTFSRDCPEYEIPTPDGGSLLLMVNHFKSKIGGGEARRTEQARQVAKIYEERRDQGWERIVVAGDLNDTPGSEPLIQLTSKTDLEDAWELDGFDSGGEDSTHSGGDRFDYIFLSPELAKAMKAGGVNRRGIWKASHKGDEDKMLSTITEEDEAASDHAAIWVELDV
jgi:endonuclease/exonuclease/phosphatase family metal-dependent hydrolase